MATAHALPVLFPPGPSRKTILVVRHAQSELNAHKHAPDSGGIATAPQAWRADAPLSALGREQAAEAAAAVAELSEAATAAVVAAAPLARSLQTALAVSDALGGSLPIAVSPLLREATKKRPIGRPLADLRAEFTDPRFDWTDATDDSWIASVEDVEAAPARAEAARAWIAARPEPDLVLITHGTFFKLLSGTQLKLVNAELRSLIVEPSGAAVLSPPLFRLASAAHNDDSDAPDSDPAADPAPAPAPAPDSLEDLARLLSSQIRGSDWLSANPATGPTLLELAAELTAGTSPPADDQPGQ